MKISCQSCQAKYTIADDKVVGKIVKIRCKKCGETIVVNGSGGTGDAIAASAYPDLPHGAGSSEPWTVNVGDDDQRSMTEPEVVAAYQAGVVTDETYCWRDGMADWLPLREIAALQEACQAGAPAPPQLQRPPGVGAAAPQGPNAGLAAGNGFANRQASVAAAPARRTGGRAPAGDLFGGVAQAGSEEDVMTSAPVGMPQARGGEPDKMVGERNENSVLFSLSALTSKGPGGPPKPTVPGVEASGLIDIKQLSAQLHSTNEKKRSGIDDIMNLSGGGAFSPSLTAPTLLTAPSMSEYSADAAAAGSGPSKNRGLIFLALGGGAFFVVAAIGAMVMLMHPKGSEADDKTAGSAAPTESAMPAASVAAAAATASAAAATTATASATATASSDTAASKPSDTKTAATAAKTTTAAATTAAAATPAPPKDNSLAAAMAGAATPAPAAAAPAAAAGADQPFNMGEAKARLASAAGAAQGCKKPDGPSGSGRVVVMFAPSGAAQSATVSGPPFEGTPTGACVAARFRGVRVPAFSGSPFSVSKSFSIN
jgi:predicted Zn finger-like uncharacterized protein